MYKQGDIVLCPFPFTDSLQTSKSRPVVIVSKDSQNKYGYIVVKVTSVIRNDDYSFPILKRDINFEIDRASEIRINEIATISNSLIVKKMGEMTKDGLERLLDAIHSNF